MLKETLTYVDFNGEKREVDAFFHMNKLEWLRFDKKYGGLKEFIQKAVRDNDEYAVLNMLEELIQSAYGEKSSDGLRFVKSPELTKKFVETDGYSNMVISFLTDTEKGIAFFNKLAPSDASDNNTVK